MQCNGNVFGLPYFCMCGCVCVGMQARNASLGQLLTQKEERIAQLQKQLDETNEALGNAGSKQGDLQSQTKDVRLFPFPLSLSPALSVCFAHPDACLYVCMSVCLDVCVLLCCSWKCI